MSGEVEESAAEKEMRLAREENEAKKASERAEAEAEAEARKEKTDRMIVEITKAMNRIGVTFFNITPISISEVAENQPIPDLGLAMVKIATNGAAVVSSCYFTIESDGDFIESLIIDSILDLYAQSLERGLQFDTANEFTHSCDRSHWYSNEKCVTPEDPGTFWLDSAPSERDEFLLMQCVKTDGGQDCIRERFGSIFQDSPDAVISAG